MRFVYQQMVNAHELEVYYIVFTVLDVEGKFLDFGLEVHLALLYAFKHAFIFILQIMFCKISK